MSLESLNEIDATRDAEPMADPEPALKMNRASLSPWLLSLGLHGAFLAIPLCFVRATPQHGSYEQTRTGGIVLVNRSDDANRYLSESDSGAELASIASSQRLPRAFPDGNDRPDLVASPITESSFDTSDMARKLVESSPSSGELTQPTLGVNQNPGQPVTVDVFGVQGTGSSFVYLFDRSGSMEGFSGRPLRAAQQQVLASIRSLSSTHQFQIVFYNDQQMVFHPDRFSSGLIFASEENKQRAVRFVESIRGEGGTDHLGGLKAACRHHADVIFILTDAEGGLSSAELDDIAKWNRASAVINVIELGLGATPSSDRSLETLALQHRGHYLYKDIQTLDEE